MAEYKGDKHLSGILNVTEKQILRGNVLRICKLSEPYGAGTEVISAALRKEGYCLDTGMIAETCEYLQNKGFIEVKRITNSVLGISRDIAKILPRGIDFLEGSITEPGIELL